MKSLKKVLSVVLATAMAFAASVTAFGAITPPTMDPAHYADYDADSDITMEGSSTIQTPTIKVSLPTTLPFIINPYEFDNFGQVVSATAEVKNLSNVPVSIGVTEAYAEPTDPTTSKVNIVAAAAKPTATTKDLYLFLRAAADANAFKEYDNGANPLVKATKTTAGDIPLVLKGSHVDNSAAPVLLVDNLVASIDGSNAATGGSAIIKVTGNSASNAVEESWTANDTAKITVCFKVIPKTAA